MYSDFKFPRTKRFATLLFSAVLISLLFLLKQTRANDSLLIRRNAVFLDLYPFQNEYFNVNFYSFNYERAFGKKGRTLLRAGITYNWQTYKDALYRFSFPLTLTWITKPLKPHHFEWGLGTVYSFSKIDRTNSTYSKYSYGVTGILLPIMYRYQKREGWFFRGGLNLLLSFETTLNPSFGAGYRF